MRGEDDRAVWIRKMCRGDREIRGPTGGPTEGKEMEVNAVIISVFQMRKLRPETFSNMPKL